MLTSIKVVLIIVINCLFFLNTTQGQTAIKHLDGSQINTNKSGTLFEHYWSKCVSAGRANEGLRASWLEQLNMVHKACGFKYVRFHGIFHDDMFVYTTNDDGSINYNWQYIDDVFDRLLSIGVKPFVELSFFPKAISSDATCFWWGGHGKPPVNFDAWKGLVDAFVKHCSQRYGSKEIHNWYFEVWNEPNLEGFWNGTKEQYFQLYQITANIIKAIDPLLKVGGPATSSYHPAEGVYDSLKRTIKNISAADFIDIQCEGPWIKDFLKFCEKENLQVDFVSSHPYPTTYPFGDGGGQFEMSRPVNSLHKDLTWLNATIKSSKYKNAEIQLTEWSSSPSNRDHTHDYLQAATYIVKANIECMGLANSLSYWIFTDIEEEREASASVFHGGWGLVNFQGIAKPAFHAYRFLNALGNEIILKEDGFMLTKHNANNFLTGIFYNYPAEVIEAAPISIGSRDKAEKTLNTGNPQIINLRLTNLKPGSKFEIEIVDKENAFSLKSWQQMGSPEPPSREQTKQLKELGLRTKKIMLVANNKGELAWNYSLGPWAIALLKQVK
jgi:xylan 1,4-beta-xylosidase